MLHGRPWTRLRAGSASIPAADRCGRCGRRVAAGAGACCAGCCRASVASATPPARPGATPPGAGWRLRLRHADWPIRAGLTARHRAFPAPPRPWPPRPSRPAAVRRHPPPQLPPWPRPTADARLRPSRAAGQRRRGGAKKWEACGFSGRQDVSSSVGNSLQRPAADKAVMPRLLRPSPGGALPIIQRRAMLPIRPSAHAPTGHRPVDDDA